MKWLSVFFTGLILTFGLCSQSAHAQGRDFIRAFQLGNTTASWTNKDGQSVLSLNGAEKSVQRVGTSNSDICGAQTLAYVWATLGGSVSVPNFEFDMLGNEVTVVIEGRFSHQPGHGVLIDLPVKSADSGWRHVSIGPNNFRGDNVEFGHSNPDTYATRITVVGKGAVMLKNFLAGSRRFDIDTNTTHSDPWQEYIGQSHVTVRPVSF